MADKAPTQEASAVTAAPEVAKAKPKPEPEKILIIAIGCKIMEPFTYTWFQEGIPVEVPAITPWMQMQIDVGLLVQV